jgi:hypothetical protein
MTEAEFQEKLRHLDENKICSINEINQIADARINNLCVEEKIKRLIKNELKAKEIEFDHKELNNLNKIEIKLKKLLDDIRKQDFVSEDQIDQEISIIYENILAEIEANQRAICELRTGFIEFDLLTRESFYKGLEENSTVSLMETNSAKIIGESVAKFPGSSDDESLA